MSVWKQGKWYWSDFTVNGERYRLALKTTDQREAAKKEKVLIADVCEGRLAKGMKAPLACMRFEEACDRYLKQRKLDMEYPGHERNLAVPLRPFFRQFRLNEITADSIRDYQAYRSGQGKHPNTVNHEVKMLFRLLKRAKLLTRIRDDIKLLPAKREPRQMLTQAEKQRLFETAAAEPEWQTAYCAALLTANTSMRPVELRRLLWQDLDPINRTVIVRRSKTEAGTRIIPLNDEAWSAFAALKQRADTLGTYAAENYILHRLWPEVDGTQPMGRLGWRRAWRSLRKAAGLPQLRFYDLRHQFVTELAEAGIPESVIRELAGHVDPTMMQVYSHPRLEARRAAVQALSVVQPAPLPQSYVINQVIKSLPGESQPS